METVSQPRIPGDASQVVIRSGGAGTLYTVPANQRLHITHAWCATGGSITVTLVQHQDTAGTRTIFGAVGGLPGLDVVVPATGVVASVGGTCGFLGWIEPLQK